MTTRAHKRLCVDLLKAVPRAWWARNEVEGNANHGDAEWRADVLANKDDCWVALETQLTLAADFARRVQAYLDSGVWSVWFFRRIHWRLPPSCIQFYVDEVACVPDILACIERLPSPKGLTPTEARAQFVAQWGAMGMYDEPRGRWRNHETGRLVELLPRGAALREVKHVHATILTAGRGHGPNNRCLGKNIGIPEKDLGTVWLKVGVAA